MATDLWSALSPDPLIAAFGKWRMGPVGVGFKSSYNTMGGRV